MAWDLRKIMSSSSSSLRSSQNEDDDDIIFRRSQAAIAQLVKRRSHNHRIAGSMPHGAIFNFVVPPRRILLLCKV
eukprot:CAMPEP_0117857110 /NCGR_PEP_ID=MMETSP0950-20121206/1681_1 /TAXON_ID=44440 /ORGANISM="Chattonella subsalsa, Strain CCMP2191" /LENGTH=74 /DNA_ID=CAMNT_0005706407 /DNA_START=741 /DNA_END=965 /DNA_ORIENTATION=-